MDKRYDDGRVEQLLGAILSELKINSTQHRLWSMDDIAAYVNKSKVTVQQRLVCKPDFPNAVRIPTKAGQLGPLWYPEDVKIFVKKHQRH